MSDPVSLNTKLTLSVVIVSVPFFAWAGGVNSRVERLEQERVEMRQEMKEIQRKLDDIRERIPLIRPKP